MASPRLDAPKFCKFDYAPPGREPQRIAMECLYNDSLFGVYRARKSFYERPLLEYIWQHVPPGGTWIDVGANIGNHSIYFAKWLAAQVIAVEPHDELRRVLTTNLARNGVANRCVVMAQYLSDSTADGPRPLYCKESQHVAAVTCDHLVFQSPQALVVNRVALIKIDTDGHDHRVLYGATRTLAEHRPVVVVEVSTPNVEALVRTRLKAHNYVVDEASRDLCATPTLACWPAETALLGGSAGE